MGYFHTRCVLTYKQVKRNLEEWNVAKNENNAS